MDSTAPEFLLFMQHGWADDNRAMQQLAEQLVTGDIPVIAPSLGYLQTWIRIKPLIQAVETIASGHLVQYPEVPLRIVGHSMGGLIWLEVLHRHPDWWPRVHSLTLVGSPVGGADLGRLIDPFGLGIGIARDLGKNRKPMAEEIAAIIPTLDIAGNLDGGSDITVPVEATRFQNARFVILEGLSHVELRNHPQVASTIQTFWSDVHQFELISYDQIVRRLQAVPGMTDGHWRGLKQSHLRITLATGGSIRTWRNAMGVDHVFVLSPQGRCLYAGFVGWLHSPDLQKALQSIEQEFGG